MQLVHITLHILAGGLIDGIRRSWAERTNDRGASTLELVILILGLITVATLLVGVLVAAVKSRTDQIT